MDPLEQYVAARAAIAKYFDTVIWYNLVICDEETWTDHGDKHNSVSWEYLPDPDDSDLGEYNYSMEVHGTSRWESTDGKYTLFIGDDGCGNRDCYIFLNSLKAK